MTEAYSAQEQEICLRVCTQYRNWRSTLGCPTQESGGPLEGGVFSTGTRDLLEGLYPVQELEVHLRSTGTGGPLEEHRNRRSTLGCPTQESGGPLEGGVFSTGTRDPLEGGAFSTGTGDLLEGGVFSTGTRNPLEGGAFSTGTGDLLEQYRNWRST